MKIHSGYIFTGFLSLAVVSSFCFPVSSWMKQGTGLTTVEAADAPPLQPLRRTFGEPSHEGQAGTYDTQSTSDPSTGQAGALDIPAADVSEEDIAKFKARADKLKPLLERDREVRPRVRQVSEDRGRISKIFLTQGYGTVISLPFAFTLDGVALGDKSKFQVEAKDNSLVIYPLKQFKQTNLIVFETVKKGNPSVHQYLLVEDSLKVSTDFQVNVQAADTGWIGAGPVSASSVNDDSFNTAVINTVIRGRVPERDTAEGLILEGRSPLLSPIKDKLPFLQKLTLTAPALYVYLINDRVTPVGSAEWVSYLDGSTTVVASLSKEVSVRRLYDGKIFSAGQ